MMRRAGFFASGGQAYQEILALLDAERRERVAAIWAQCEENRASRVSEKPRQWKRDAELTPEQERAFAKRRMVSGLTNFWTMIHAEDSAQTFEKGLTANYEGAHPLFVTQAQNVASVDSEGRLQLFYPDVSERTRPIVGIESLVSIERARTLISFEPEYSFA